jgi:hypothetical protein
MHSPCEHPAANLTVRKLHIDLSHPFEREWNGDRAFVTAFQNALSMSFPVGEQFFIDAVRAGVAHLPDTPAFDTLRQTVKNFVGQEATHRQLHAQFNRQLAEQGLVNHWEVWALRRIERLRQVLSRHRGKAYLTELAVTAAYEHLTALMAEEVLSQIDQPGDWFAQANPTLQTLWRWHAAEEAEHKSVAFDLYITLGGNRRARIRAYLMVLFIFSVDATRQTLGNLYRSGQLFKPSTWLGAATFIFGRYGVLRRLTSPTLAYLRRDFHPDQLGTPALGQSWLQQHAMDWHAVGTPVRPAPA